MAAHGSRLARDAGCQETAQLRPRSLSGVAIIGERHPHNHCPHAELGEVEGVGRARIDNELRHAWLLPLRQPSAVPRGGHLVLRPDENERRNVKFGAGCIGAGRIESGRSFERGRLASRPAAGCDFERRVASLRKPNDGDPGGVDERPAGQIGQSAIGVGQGWLEVDRAGLLEASRRKVVNEQGDIAPGSDPLADRSPRFRQAEAGVQKDDAREGPCSVRPRQVALDRLDLTGADEFDRSIGCGGSGAGQEPQEGSEPRLSKTAQEGLLRSLTDRRAPASTGARPEFTSRRRAQRHIPS
jgi:hypothetical protein